MRSRAGASGFTLIELLGVLAVAAIVIAGVTTMVNSSLEDMRAQGAAAHQAQVADAAERYVNANYQVLRSNATATEPALITLAALKIGHHLADGVSDTNAFNQGSCVLVLQPAAGKLQALVLTQGGAPIPDRNGQYVAAQSGKGGGFIGTRDPAKAFGAFGSWELGLAPFDAPGCNASAGHLASALFFDGPSTSANDFLYRVPVKDHPELNGMAAPLSLLTVTEGSTDDCDAADAYAGRRVATDGAGHVLTCSNGRWQRQGSAFWKDPVPNQASLPAAAFSAVGDVVMTLDTLTTYKWDGAAWTPLAVDREGNLEVPNRLSTDTLQLRKVAVEDEACTVKGLLARDADGSTLSCDGTVWKSQAMKAESVENFWHVIMPSPYNTYGPTEVYVGGSAYNAEQAVQEILISRVLVLKKAGVVSFNGWSIMNRSLEDDPTVWGRVRLEAHLTDLDTEVAVGYSKAMSPMIRNDSSAINATLVKPLPKNIKGYRLDIYLRWQADNAVGCNCQSIYNRSNHRDGNNVLVEDTPLQAGWTVDLFY